MENILLKSDSRLPKFCFIWFNFKDDEKGFYFTLKAVSVLKIFKFLSWMFGHVEKKAKLER